MESQGGVPQEDGSSLISKAALEEHVRGPKHEEPKNGTSDKVLMQSGISEKTDDFPEPSGPAGKISNRVSL